MPYPSMPYGQSVAVFYPFGYPAPYTYALELTELSSEVKMTGNIKLRRIKPFIIAVRRNVIFYFKVEGYF
jgi:hypothetical protein